MRGGGEEEGGGGEEKGVEQEGGEGRQRDGVVAEKGGICMSSGFEQTMLL